MVDRTATSAKVYNIEVSGNHNYYVNTDERRPDDLALVHNCNKLEKIGIDGKFLDAAKIFSSVLLGSKKPNSKKRQNNNVTGNGGKGKAGYNDQVGNSTSLTVIPKSFKKGTENVKNFEGLNSARDSARKYAGLEGEKTVPFVQEIGPHKGKVTGSMTPDGKKGWRIDWDSEKGFHVNWWDRTTNPGKRSEWMYGANKIEGKSLDDFLSVLEHFPKE